MKWSRLDKHRFTALVRPHFDALYSAAWRLTRNAADSEDLVQDVCLKAYQRLDDLESAEYPKAWLLRVLYNQFVDTYRSRSTSPVDLAGTGEDSAEPDSLVASEARPEELVDDERQRDAIIRAMSILNSEACSLLALHDIEGYSLQELEELTGMPAGTIKSRLYRTRTRLGRLLSNKAFAGSIVSVIGAQE